MTERCGMELCPHWAGDGDVCPCVVFDLQPGKCRYATCSEPGDPFCVEHSRWQIVSLCDIEIDAGEAPHVQ